ncbi:hypothetical protein J6590_030370 [Homalodisca vitripennis]|nr:hypothetical protein J6590_030370 [Homalodisca vitripennis]
MNILFRKNFQSDGAKGRVRSGGGAKRTGDYYGYSAMEDHHGGYRTHIFLNPSNLPQEYEGDLPSSLSAKRPSVTLMRWATGGTKRKPSGGKTDYPLNQNDTPSRQEYIDGVAPRIYIDVTSHHWRKDVVADIYLASHRLRLGNKQKRLLVPCHLLVIRVGLCRHYPSSASPLLLFFSTDVPVCFLPRCSKNTSRGVLSLPPPPAIPLPSLTPLTSTLVPYFALPRLCYCDLDLSVRVCIVGIRTALRN